MTPPSEPTVTRPAATSGEGGLTVLPKLAVVRSAAGGELKKQKKRRHHSGGGNSDYVSSVDSLLLRTGVVKPDEPVVKFGNMLDHCYSEGSDAEGPKRVKSAVVKPAGVRAKPSPDVFDKKGEQKATGMHVYVMCHNVRHSLSCTGALSMYM